MEEFHCLAVKLGAVLQQPIITVVLCDKRRAKRNDCLIQERTTPYQIWESLIEILIRLQQLRWRQETVDERRQQLRSDLEPGIESRDLLHRIDRNYCSSRPVTLCDVLSLWPLGLLRIIDRRGRFVDEDPLSFITGADMAILDAPKTFGLGFIALYISSALSAHLQDWNRRI